ncbi:ABC transporter ATP-binding protein [Serpentinicella sp. ANB-PHB4]|uniref:ABC transporter ATP-binding protein n=1 Tax=Serpentinicella sp. ANB-PHB4 TaxID=3074076 RepID=UPI00286244FB|nr:ABC transporter ATP-binding protein [Serpentinicella sp. ANB-PHB4]MDR5658477.1 ABC transporter ATP-binding protein [Serpentinicella sp. ANB-PHB4]
MDNIIKMKGVEKIYGTNIKTQVLYDINLSFEAGSFNSIIGQSGSGKSTLLNIMGTLDNPTNGEVYINGKNTTEMTKNQLANLRNDMLGFIFQFHYLLPEFKVIENILMPHYIKGGQLTSDVEKRAEYLIDMLGLTKVKNNLATQLSGGQQQRTAIARALMNNPKVILADEPTGNLDSDTSEDVYNLLRDINKQFNTTFVIITHDQRIAEKADRIIEINDGRINMDFKR